MPGNARRTPEDDSRLAERRSGDDGVRPIREVLAELLAQYRVRFPELSVMVVEESAAG